jgi:undecaprenyl diphosphate synthase
MPTDSTAPEHALTDADREALARMARLTPHAAPLEHLPDVPPARIPRHVAIIMDGNGRWATREGLPHAEGHRRGAETVRRVVEECGRLGVEAVTLYSFSTENWKRSREEVDALMQLCIAYCQSERESLVREGVRVRVIGRIHELPADVREALGQLVEATSKIVGPTLCLAINYGSRQEITDAVRDLAAQVDRKELAPEAINEAKISNALGTAGLPDPDLVIRTAGEMRVSNFLLWQISYAELYVSDVFWPEFSTEHLRGAIRAFASRERRFGARPAPAPPATSR